MHAIHSVHAQTAKCVLVLPCFLVIEQHGIYKIVELELANKEKWEAVTMEVKSEMHVEMWLLSLCDRS
jgi:hypothetical protein